MPIVLPAIAPDLGIWTVPLGPGSAALGRRLCAHTADAARAATDIMTKSVRIPCMNSSKKSAFTHSDAERGVSAAHPLRVFATPYGRRIHPQRAASVYVLRHFRAKQALSSSSSRHTFWIDSPSGVAPVTGVRYRQALASPHSAL